MIPIFCRLNIVRCLVCTYVFIFATTGLADTPVHSIEPRRVGISEKIDTTSAEQDTERSLVWIDVRQLVVEGKGFDDTEQFFHRLPARAKEKLPKGLWHESTCSAGMAIRFVTDAHDIWVRWKLARKTHFSHMADTGINGFDLYVYLDGLYHWVGIGKPEGKQPHEWQLAKGMDGQLHEYMLYLPLYNELVSAEVGLSADATIGKPLPRPVEQDKPICFYGTSIIQGACASRPGMAVVAQVGRRLDRPTINLGFSGTGRMEIEIAELLAELDVAVYVLDCLPNMSDTLLRERLMPFVLRLREKKPDTPIVLVESLLFPSRELIQASKSQHAHKNAILRKLYNRLQVKGAQELYYVPADVLIGTDGEGTVDGVHPNDLGFHRFADALEPMLRSIFRD